MLRLLQSKNCTYVLDQTDWMRQIVVMKATISHLDTVSYKTQLCCLEMPQNCAFDLRQSLHHKSSYNYTELR